MVGFRVTSLGTLFGRVLGMVRDTATAALLGMSAGGVMDAFVIAFRVPDLFRRLFGEGALTASYLPALARKLEQDRAAAWQLLSAMLLVVAAAVGAFVLFGELVCGLLWFANGDLGPVSLMVGLAAVMLPYAVLICLTAYISTTLHALGHFSVPAFATSVFNVTWLAAAWLVAPHFGPDRAAQAYVLAVAVLLGGCAQIVFQWPVLRRFGFRFGIAWRQSRQDVRAVLASLAPTMFALAVTQMNTFVDSITAWALTMNPSGPRTIAWLFGVEYPVRQGGAAAIYYSEKLYSFPLGIVGLAIATAIYPLLSRHAARGDHAKLGEDLVTGMRLVVYLAIPAGVGLAVIGEPLARLLFERGEFTAADTVRTSRMIVAYAVGVPAFCALPVVIRGYFAMGDFATPVRVGAAAIVLNLVLNAALVWPLAELGLALATVATATFHAIILLAVLARRNSSVDARLFLGTFVRSAIASGAMALIALAVLHLFANGPSLVAQLVRVSATLAASVAAYFLVSQLLGGREYRLLSSNSDRA